MSELPNRDVVNLPAHRQSGNGSLESNTGENLPDWRRYLSAVRRYKWWIIAFTILGTGAGAAASRYLPPRYFAQATIWIQTSEGRGPDRGPIGASQLLAASAWGDLVKSYVVLDEVVRERRLYLHAKPRDLPTFADFAVADHFVPGQYRLRVDRDGQTFRLEDVHGQQLQEGTVGEAVGTQLGFKWQPAASVLPPDADMVFGLTPLRDAAKALGDELHVTVDPSGNFLRVSLTGGQESAAAIVNAVVTRYIAVATELRRARLTELARLLHEQLQAAEGNLRQAERALEDLRVRTITLPGDPASATPVGAPRGSVVSEYFDRKIEIDQIRGDRDAIARALASRDSAGIAIDALALIGAVQRAPDLNAALTELTTKRAERRALGYRYTDDHPAVRHVLTDIEVLEHNTIPGLARALSAELETRQRTLSNQVETRSRELQDIPQRTIEEARLRRDVSIAENLFSGVQQRYSEARLAEASSIADVRLLDAAVAPQSPIKDPASRLLMLGLLGGLAFGLAGAVLADRFDPRVRYPDQVTGDMGLQVLGAMPHVKNRRAGTDDEQIAQVLETMRSVRFNLLHAYGTAGPMVITVASPGIGDGKSFLSTNLALAFAHAGQRTLLIDGDTRRGVLHRTLRASRKPGLTDVLAGRTSLESATQTLRYASLHFIGGGSRQNDSPELLGSPAMVELLVRLRGLYQVILVDSPPLGAGVDAYSLGSLTGAMLVVLRTGSTNMSLARNKLALLPALPIRLLGVVLNDVESSDIYGYYGYLSSYGTTDESVTPPPAAPGERSTARRPTVRAHL